jgi:hypothetical protein
MNMFKLIMKKVVVISAMVITLFACGGEDKESAKQLEALADRVEAIEMKILELEKVKEEVVSSGEMSKNLFYCKGNGQPIRLDQVQNGTCDCPDGSDERPGTCK